MRLLGHFRGLTLADVRSMPLRDFNALVDQMSEDLENERRQARGRTVGGNGERRIPVMT